MKRIMLTVMLTAGLVTGAAFATSGSGVTNTGLGAGTLEEVDVKVKTGEWELELKTEGPSELGVSELKIVPGGHSGWHSHPGPSLVIVKSGTLTFYRGDDSTCTGRLQPAGSAFVDPGGVVHIARNEGSVDLVLLTTRLIPSGAAARIDEPDPGNCSFE